MCQELQEQISLNPISKLGFIIVMTTMQATQTNPLCLFAPNKKDLLYLQVLADIPIRERPKRPSASYKDLLYNSAVLAMDVSVIIFEWFLNECLLIDR